MDQRRIAKIRREATERVNKNALVQFRIESQYMEELIATAHEKGLSVSALARMWLLERLKKERSA